MNMSVLKTMAMVAGFLLITAVSATPANNSEQLVFSDTGGTMSLVGNSNTSSTPFGFWIWCAGQAASGSNGGYQNFNACQGSMYFYALEHNAEHVIDDPNNPLTENGNGFYTINVVQGTAAELFSGNLNPSFSCSLTNTTAASQAAQVTVSCDFAPALGGGKGTATVTAVVNVTGPK